MTSNDSKGQTSLTPCEITFPVSIQAIVNVHGPVSDDSQVEAVDESERGVTKDPAFSTTLGQEAPAGACTAALASTEAGLCGHGRHVRGPTQGSPARVSYITVQGRTIRGVRRRS